MKKLSAILLLFITVAAVFIPCCSFDNCSNEMAIESNEPETGGDCSPLSCCSSCNTNIVLNATSIVAALPSGKKNFDAIVDQQLYSIYLSAFWQPPKQI